MNEFNQPQIIDIIAELLSDKDLLDVVAGKTNGAQSGGSLTVKYKDKQIQAIAVGDVPPGDCIALRETDTGKWYAVTAYEYQKDGDSLVRYRRWRSKPPTAIVYPVRTLFIFDSLLYIGGDITTRLLKLSGDEILVFGDGFREVYVEKYKKNKINYYSQYTILVGGITRGFIFVVDNQLTRLEFPGISINQDFTVSYRITDDPFLYLGNGLWEAMTSIGNSVFQLGTERKIVRNKQVETFPVQRSDITYGGVIYRDATIQTTTWNGYLNQYIEFDSDPDKLFGVAVDQKAGLQFAVNFPFPANTNVINNRTARIVYEIRVEELTNSRRFGVFSTHQARPAGYFSESTSRGNLSVTNVGTTFEFDRDGTLSLTQFNSDSTWFNVNRRKFIPFPRIVVDSEASILVFKQGYFKQKTLVKSELVNDGATVVTGKNIIRVRQNITTPTNEITLHRVDGTIQQINTDDFIVSANFEQITKPATSATSFNLRVGLINTSDSTSLFWTDRFDFPDGLEIKTNATIFDTAYLINMPILYSFEVFDFQNSQFTDTLIKGTITSAVFSLNPNYDPTKGDFRRNRSYVDLVISIVDRKDKIRTSFKNTLISDNGSYFAYHLRRFTKSFDGISFTYVNDLLSKQTVTPLILQPLAATFLPPFHFNQVTLARHIARTDNLIGSSIFSVDPFIQEQKAGWVEQWDIKENGDVKYVKAFKVPYFKITKQTWSGNVRTVSHSYYP